MLLWLRLTQSPSLFSSLCPPAVRREVTKLEARGSPARPFFFPGQRDCHPFQFSETLLCFHFHSSDITGKRNWTDVLVILRHLLNGIQGGQRGQKPRPLDSSYSLLAVCVPCYSCSGSWPFLWGGEGYVTLTNTWKTEWLAWLPFLIACLFKCPCVLSRSKEGQMPLWSVL